ncbi:MAG: hypothetical protein AAF547_08765 [Actinomycetota bacterium]
MGKLFGTQRGAQRLAALLRRGQPTEPSLEADTSTHYDDQEGDIERPEAIVDDKRGILASEVVRHATDERIRNEAIRQLDSLDLDGPDGDARIEPLPHFDGAADVLEGVAAVEHEADRDATEQHWDEVRGQFVPEDDGHQDAVRDG